MKSINGALPYTAVSPDPIIHGFLGDSSSHSQVVLSSKLHSKAAVCGVVGACVVERK